MPFSEVDEQKPAEIDRQSMLRGFILIRSIGLFLLGVALCYGGPARFSAAGFASARAVPGGVYTWGVTVAVAGAVALVGVARAWQRLLVVSGMWLQGLWVLFFMISLTKTALASDKGALTGPVAYLMIAAECLLFAVGSAKLP